MAGDQNRARAVSYEGGGGNGQTDSSDFRGHEIRLAWTIRNNLNLVNRLYIVESVSSRQDGNRFRLDLNYKF